MNRRMFLGAAMGAVGAASLAQAAEPAEVVLLASTIGPIDAGIVPALAKAFHARTGVVVRFVGAGTGATLEMSKRGEFDLVMVHALSLEKKFMADGFGLDRRDVMYNDFVLLGPASDPAGIKGMSDPKAALRRIAEAQVRFVTRGDNSGTHVAEKVLWERAGLQPQGAWYEVFEKGASGNGPTLRHADERGAYVLMDRATWLVLKAKLSLALLVENHPDLFNFIAVIRTNPERFPKANAAGAQRFADWLVGDEAQGLIAEYGRAEYGAPLFFANAGSKVRPPGL
ncbi:putative ABC-type tungstate transport system, permease component [Magnetospirillum sp. XM-1]|uniref:substrate-binding domain-containing protein n=1 Tax=Magnetospirillum sp. XM-1 TaxID=1663591 RepID=UPI00073DD9E9|nr:substrate-binding domain-containing protein [Magnetospirillum sp. XM-1]CUW39263.1 putative ABC-type tungstate transport system, permease component [Magnetospirillum sp. XM-1]